MALCATAKQFHQLCAEAAWSKLRMSPRIALRCVYGLPHLQQLALVQRAQALAESWRDEEMPLEIAHCKEHGRCRQLRRGAVTRAQRRDNPGLADGADRHAWGCDDHHPELLTAMTLALYCAAARRRAAAAVYGQGSGSDDSSSGPGSPPSPAPGSVLGFTPLVGRAAPRPPLPPATPRPLQQRPHPFPSAPHPSIHPAAPHPHPPPNSPAPTPPHPTLPHPTASPPSSSRPVPRPHEAHPTRHSHSLTTLLHLLLYSLTW